VANVILTSGGLVQAPEPDPPPHEGDPMAEADVFPRWMYPAGGPTEPDYGGRCFNSKEELDAASAEGPWFPTPQAAQAARATTPPAPTPPTVPDEGEGPAPRRR
jgi:hypothetical protein